MAMMRPAVALQRMRFLGIVWLATTLLQPASAVLEIGEDTTWVADQEIKQQVLILPGKTLRIRGNSPHESVVIDLHEESKETGGGFKISPGAKLELENVVLTRTNEEGDFPAISFVDETDASVVMTHVRCEKQATCVVRFCCGGNEVFIQDSTFYKNRVALAGNGRMDSVKRSLFVDNDLALTNADWDVEDCVFFRNKQASNAANSRFVRTIFMENAQAVSDPGGDPNPFLSDVLFYRNGKAVLPSLVSSEKHASIERVSFIENRSPIYCTSKLPPLLNVNFIKNTGYDIIYAGTSPATLAPDVYWGPGKTKKTVKKRIYDGNSGSNGGIVTVEEFAEKPYVHDVILGLLKYKPTELVGDLEQYFPDWKDAPPHGKRIEFDFGKLVEWTRQDKDEIVIEPAKPDDAPPEPVVEVKDAETDGVVEVPQDVVVEQATAPPVPQIDDVPEGGVEEKATNAQESYDEHHETSQHEENNEPGAQIDVSTQTAAKMIHTYDEEGSILFVSLLLNACLLWVMSVLAFDFCRRNSQGGHYSRLQTEDRDDDKNPDYKDNHKGHYKDDSDYRDELSDDNKDDDTTTVEDDEAYAAKNVGKVHVV